MALETQFVSDRMSRRSVARLLRSGSADIHVIPLAQRPHELAAACVLLSRVNGRSSRIYSIIVDPAFRGRGLAQALMMAAEDAARRRSASRLTLEVRADNDAARGLYQKLGFVVGAHLPAYYDDGADGLRLVKTLR